MHRLNVEFRQDRRRTPAASTVRPWTRRRRRLRRQRCIFPVASSGFRP
jgi:hypothetical protein